RRPRMAGFVVLPERGQRLAEIVGRAPRRSDTRSNRSCAAASPRERTTTDLTSGPAVAPRGIGRIEWPAREDGACRAYFTFLTPSPVTPRVMRARPYLPSARHWGVFSSMRTKEVGI